MAKMEYFNRKMKNQLKLSALKKKQIDWHLVLFINNYSYCQIDFNAYLINKTENQVANGIMELFVDVKSFNKYSSIIPT